MLNTYQYMQVIVNYVVLHDIISTMLKLFFMIIKINILQENMHINVKF